ncbi:hypothetical protein OPT61_g10316 [Boeremia exigua]|uniref:Uncharacterized protein n=1 Tax=Boeremia exigua TaxID=749465 RepID=A0ACC2HR63_9PLEO|nr:hypothetical protein OPT61_g10316 [Boeremia exigua]
MSYFTSLTITFLLLSTAYADYARDAESAIKLLQDKWYNTETGLWSDMWWQSGNIVETIARFGIQDADFKQAAIDIVSNTYDKSPNQKGYKNWKNDFYDDEGWWAMGWIATYDLTGDQKYLNTAKDLFEDMTTGWTTPCNGGIWWNKPKESIASISNELFLAVGASLANRVPAEEKDQNPAKTTEKQPSPTTKASYSPASPSSPKQKATAVSSPTPTTSPPPP